MAKKERELPPAEILRARDVMAMTGIRSQSTLNVMSKTGEFPPKISLGRSLVGWRAADVRAWIANRPEV